MKSEYNEMIKLLENTFYETNKARLANDIKEIVMSKIPELLIIVPKGSQKIPVLVCPKCHNQPILNAKSPFCAYCGKALDWRSQK